MRKYDFFSFGEHTNNRNLTFYREYYKLIKLLKYGSKILSHLNYFSTFILKNFICQNVPILTILYFV